MQTSLVCLSCVSAYAYTLENSNVNAKLILAFRLGTSQYGGQIQLEF